MHYVEFGGAGGLCLVVCLWRPEFHGLTASAACVVVGCSGVAGHLVRDSETCCGALEGVRWEHVRERVDALGQRRVVVH